MHCIRNRIFQTIPCLKKWIFPKKKSGKHPGGKSISFTTGRKETIQNDNFYRFWLLVTLGDGVIIIMLNLPRMCWITWHLLNSLKLLNLELLRWKFQVISTTRSLCSSGMVAHGIWSFSDGFRWDYRILNIWLNLHLGGMLPLGCQILDVRNWIYN